MPDPEAKADRRSRRRSTAIEIGSAAVLSLAGLLTTWAGYQSDLWTGVQQARYTQSGVLRQQAAREQLRADQLQSVEVMLFAAWMNARASGELSLAEWYQERFPPRLKDSFDEWERLDRLERPGRPSSPFSMPSYQRTNRDAVRSDAAAATAFDDGQQANRTSDSFSQANVMLAMAMFFAGMAQVFRIHHLRIGLLAIGIVVCMIGAVKVAGLPVLQPG